MMKNDQPKSVDPPPINDGRLQNLLAPPKKRGLKLILAGLTILLLTSFVILATPILKTLNKISVKNLSGGSQLLDALSISGDKLLGENENRINFLIIGLGGPGHKGPFLTDTLIAASLDPINQEIATLSIPRDLAINYPKPLRGGGKINNVYALAEQAKTLGGGPAALKTTVSEVLGLPIHYFFQVDFEAFKKIVDLVGGIDVVVPDSIYDPLYPDSQLIGYEPFKIDAGPQHLDGKTALKYVRTRQTSSDFARSKRQMEVIKAVRDKVLTSQVIANPKKIIEILNILGNHVRTDLSTREMQRLIGLIRDVPPKNMVTKVLDTTTDGPLTSTTGENGAYLIVPKSGNFKDVQRIAREIFRDPYIKKEQATIVVENAAGVSGVAIQLAEQLKTDGYQVIGTTKAPKTETQTTIIDHSQGQKTATLEFLKKRLSWATVKQQRLEASDRGSRQLHPDLTIVVGQDHLREANLTTNQSLSPKTVNLETSIKAIE